MNNVIIKDEVVYIELVGKYTGRTAMTDAESYFKYKLYEHTWRSCKLGYVYTIVNSKSVYMHRIITENDTSNHTDHIKNTDDPIKDKLDNRKSNLRIVTNRMNQINARKRMDNTTGYKGVSFNKKVLYVSQIKWNGRKYYVGGFNQEKYEKAAIMAAYAYDLASVWLYGDIAQHNEIKVKYILSDEEMKIVEDTVQQKVEKHMLPRHKEMASIGVDTISRKAV